MGGGLIQLVAYGSQDIYLTGNPQITFFKLVYRRHSNFSIECIKQTIDGAVTADESDISFTIDSSGDLLYSLWLDVVLPSSISPPAGGNSIGWVNNTGAALVKEYSVDIGGQIIDKRDSNWIDIWNELSDHDEQYWSGLNKTADLKMSTSGAPVPNNQKLYIPLDFWFTKNPGLALPLIALQYHEIKINIKTRSMIHLLNHDSSNSLSNLSRPTKFELWADYIFLDTDERRRFAQSSHEYLIEQVQINKETSNSSSLKHDLTLNHPVKELIWVFRTTSKGEATTNVNASQNDDNNTGQEGNDYFKYMMTQNQGTTETIAGVESQEGFGTLTLKLNGHDRFKRRDASYFRICQPIQAGHKVPLKHIYCYSFALKPEEHQPSGTCNFSRIDNAQLVFTGSASNADLLIYAINYNVLRIMSGMGGLAYSN